VIRYQLFVSGCVIRTGDKTGVRPCPYAVPNEVGFRLQNRTGLSLHTGNSRPTRGLRPSKAARFVNPRWTNLTRMPFKLNTYTVTYIACLANRV
jgi:hypothetical protein